MTATPDHVTRLVADITDLLSRGIRAGGGGSGVTQRRESVDQGYRWLFQQAYGIAVSDPPGARSCPECGGDGWTYLETRTPPWERCESCGSAVRGDTTGDIVANRERQMAAVRRAGDELTEAKVRVARCVAIIRGEMERKWDPIPTPRTEPRAGVAAAVAAQGRRAARGEGWGDA